MLSKVRQWKEHKVLIIQFCPAWLLDPIAPIRLMLRSDVTLLSAKADSMPTTERLGSWEAVKDKIVTFVCDWKNREITPISLLCNERMLESTDQLKSDKERSWVPPCRRWEKNWRNKRKNVSVLRSSKAYHRANRIYWN